jgi:hypothetical protein
MFADGPGASGPPTPPVAAATHRAFAAPSRDFHASRIRGSRRVESSRSVGGDVAMIRLSWAAGLALGLCVLAAPAFAVPPEEPHPRPVPDAALWAPGRTYAVVPRDACGYRRRNSVDLTIPIWVPGVSGTFASGGTDVSTDGDALRDLAESTTSLEFAFMGRVDARLCRWIVYGDVFQVMLDETLETTVDGADASGGVEALVGRLLGGYRVIDHRPLGGCSRLDVDLLAGARVYYAEVSLDEPETLSIQADETWIDPLIGVRARLDLPGPVDVQVLGDIGGFGVGSELSWSLTLEASWRVSRLLSILVGYSWLSIDYDVGGDGDRFVFDLAIHGPQIGLTFHL